MDFRAGNTNQVFNVADGEVIRVIKGNPSFGNVVIIKHDDNVLSLYAHLDIIDPNIIEGKKLEARTMLGNAGKTGTTVNHLHFELIDGNMEWKDEEGIIKTILNHILDSKDLKTGIDGKVARLNSRPYFANYAINQVIKQMADNSSDPNFDPALKNNGGSYKTYNQITNLNKKAIIDQRSSDIFSTTIITDEYGREREGDIRSNTIIKSANSKIGLDPKTNQYVPSKNVFTFKGLDGNDTYQIEPPLFGQINITDSKENSKLILDGKEITAPAISIKDQNTGEVIKNSWLLKHATSNNTEKQYLLQRINSNGSNTDNKNLSDSGTDLLITPLPQTSTKNCIVINNFPFSPALEASQDNSGNSIAPFGIKLGDKSKEKSEFAVGNETDDSSYYKIYPHIIQLTSKNMLAIWQDGKKSGSEYIRSLDGVILDKNGNKLGSLLSSLSEKNQYIDIDDSFQAASLKNDHFVVTWSKLGKTDTYAEVYAQIFSANNGEIKKISSKIRVGNDTFTKQSPCITSLSNGGFVIAYEKYNSKQQICAQVFDKDGNKIKQELTIADNIIRPSISSLSNDNFVIAWKQDPNPGSETGRIYGQIFDSNANKIGQEFLIVTNQSYRKILPVISALRDGKFIFTWTQSDLGHGVYAQIMNVDGTKLGEEFVVNTYIHDFITGQPIQYPDRNSSVALLSDGKFVITWMSQKHNNSNPFPVESYAQIFNPDGTKFGTEFNVSEPMKNQEFSHVSSMIDGGFFIIWTETQNNLGNYLRAKIFDNNGKALTESAQIDSTQLPSIKLTQIGSITQDVTSLAAIGGDNNIFQIASASAKCSINGFCGVDGTNNNDKFDFSLLLIDANENVRRRILKGEFLNDNNNQEKRFL